MFEEVISAIDIKLKKNHDVVFISEVIHDNLIKAKNQKLFFDIRKKKYLKTINCNYTNTFI